MSGVLSAIQVAGQLFAGYGTVTLGPIILGDASELEIPTSLPIGGEQMLQIHKLPGGLRIFDAMGQDDAPIGWSGLLDGQDASMRARSLDKLRRAGQQITLAWDVYSYLVVVSSFQCDTRLVPPMPYQIEVEVVQDNSLVSGISPVSMALQVTQDLKSGNVVRALGSVSQGIVGSSVSDAATAAAAPGATTVGSADYAAAVNSVNTAATNIQTATTAVNNTLAPLGVSLASISATAPAALDTLGFSNQITQAVSSAGDLAQLSAASGYVNRASQNLKSASA